MPTPIVRNHHSDQMQTQEKVLHPELLNRLPDVENLRCLDAGCGEGGIASFIKGHRPTWSLSAGDLPGQVLDTARHKLAKLATIVELDLTKPLPFEDQSFDVVVSVCTFMWLDDRQFASAANEMIRILSSAGQFFLIDVHPDWQGEKLEGGIPADGKTVPVGDNWRNREITNWWRSRQTYGSLLEDAGFQVALSDIAIPAELGLAPRYERKVGSTLYLVAGGVKG